MDQNGFSVGNTVDSNIMNILYTVNNSFAPQLAAGICSVCENNREASEIHFFVIGEGVSRENKESLAGLVAGYSRSIQFIDIDGLNREFGEGFDTGAWNEIILARLLMGRLLPNSVKKVLYLDGDTIVRKSLVKLWGERPLGAAVVAMAPEPTASASRRESLGIGGKPYYNSGVILVDLEKWRRENVERRILDFCREKAELLVASDQDAINVVLAGEIDSVSPEYNASNIFTYYPFRFLDKLMPGFADKGSYQRARCDPSIVHYLGEERPWRRGNTHKFKDDYDFYLSLTPFSCELKEEGWGLYYAIWRLFNDVTRPFPSMRYKIINGLIPVFLNMRSRKRKK